MDDDTTREAASANQPNDGPGPEWGGNGDGVAVSPTDPSTERPTPPRRLAEELFNYQQLYVTEDRGEVL
jgi:hypothetical protein